MTDKRTNDSRSTEADVRKLEPTKIDEVASKNAGHDAPDLDAAGAKASVHEAIGKLIGDDTERRRGTADKQASGITPGRPR